jgi:hypothetical protein
MRLFLQDGPARIQILSRSNVTEFRDVGAAREFLRPLLANEGNVAAIRRAVGYEQQLLSKQDLLDQLASRIVHEGLQIVSCADGYLAAIQGTFTEAASQAAATQQPATTTPAQDEEAAQAQPAADERHWIEIALVDDDGNPVPNEMYVIELPDGTQRTGVTDGDGKARVSGVDPGTAKVSFPNLDKSSYEPQ